MKSKILFFLMIIFVTISAQNNLRVSINNKPPHPSDTTSLAKEREANVERFNQLIAKINTLESQITNNKKEFYDSIANIYSYIALGITLILAVGGFMEFRSINKRFDDYKKDLDSRFTNLQNTTTSRINEGLNSELQKAIDKASKSFYEEPIEELSKRYYEMSVVLETVKNVFEIRTGKPLILDAYGNAQPRKTASGNAFGEGDENGK